MPFGVTYDTKVVLAKTPNRRAFWKEIDKEMRKQGQEYKTMYRSWTSTWQSKPRYKVTIKRDTRHGLMTGTVTPTADEGLLQIMNWVIHGTGSHVGKGYYPIPKEAKSGADPLRYRGTYTPATQPGIIQSGAASYSGPWKGATQVWHPGIRPRDIINFILLRRKYTYFNAMGEALKRAMLASVKAGRT